LAEIYYLLINISYRVLMDNILIIVVLFLG